MEKKDIVETYRLIHLYQMSNPYSMKHRLVKRKLKTVLANWLVVARKIIENYSVHWLKEGGYFPDTSLAPIEVSLEDWQKSLLEEMDSNWRQQKSFSSVIDRAMKEDPVKWIQYLFKDTSSFMPNLYQKIISQPEDLTKQIELFHLFLQTMHQGGRLLEHSLKDRSNVIPLLTSLSEDVDPKNIEEGTERKLLPQAPRGYYTERTDWLTADIKSLLRIADSLDSKGFYIEANDIDNILKEIEQRDKVLFTVDDKWENWDIDKLSERLNSIKDDEENYTVEVYGANEIDFVFYDNLCDIYIKDVLTYLGLVEEKIFRLRAPFDKDIYKIGALARSLGFRFEFEPMSEMDIELAKNKWWTVENNRLEEL